MTRLGMSAAVSAVASVCCLAVHAQEQRYRIIDLTEVAEGLGVVQAEARAINERGDVAGFEVVEPFIERAIVWRCVNDAAILPRLLGDNSALAVGVAPDGTVLGVSELVTIEQQGEQQRVTEDQKAVLWRDGQVVDLNSLRQGGDEFIDLKFAQDANSHGHIVGFAGLVEPPPFNSNGFLVVDGIVTDLGALSRPVAINEHDQIVGWNGSGQDHAMLWEDGETTDLHDHPSIGGVTSRAHGLNDDAWIAGEAQFHISKPEEPALWIDGAPQRLIPDINRPQGVASAVNGSGAVVGYYNDLDDTNSPFIGFLWEDGERTPLLDMVPPDDGWQVLFPFDMNDRGWIVGGGRRNGEWGRAFLMIPIVDTRLRAFSVLDGMHVSGGIAELEVSDDTYVVTEARVTGEVAQPHLLRIRLTAETDIDRATAMEVTIESRITDVEAQTTVFLRDWVGGSFVQVDQFSVGMNDGIHTTEVWDAGDFVRASDGRIRMELKQIVFFPFTLGGFQTFFDLIELSVF